MGKSLEEILKDLNKGRLDKDRFKIAIDEPEDHFITKVVTTGSPYIDYKISKEFGKGGIPLGRFILYIGGEGSGKTSLSLIFGGIMQRLTGKTLLIFDGEGTIDESYFKRFKIDKSLLIHRKDNNLEDFLNTCEALSKSDDICCIIVDSLPIFFSTAVEQKAAEDNTMSVEAKKFNTRMPIIYGNCNRRDIPLIALNYYKMTPGGMGDPRILTRGEWQKYFSSVSLEFAKGDLILDSEDEVIGHKLRFRIKKSKISGTASKNPYEVDFYYEFGFDVVSDYVTILIEEDFIKRGGAWYTLPNGDKMQGKEAVIEFFRSNEEYLLELYKNMCENVA